MGRSIDEILSVAGDVATLFTGNPMFAAAGNAFSATDSAIGGRDKDALSFGLQAVAAPVASYAGQLGGQAGGQLGSVAGETGAQIGSEAGKLVGEIAGPLATGAILEPTLAKSLGLTQSSRPSPTTMIPKSPSTATGGGAGPGSAPGGLDIQGGTAPKIYPYTQAPTGGSIGAQPSAQMQQPRSI